MQSLGKRAFCIAGMEKNDFMSFKANENYWRTTPTLKQVIFTFFSSPDPMIMSLKQGDIDVIGSELTPIAAKALSRDGNVKVVNSPNLYYRHICINSSDFGKGHPALRTPGSPRPFHGRGQSLFGEDDSFRFRPTGRFFGHESAP